MYNGFENYETWTVANWLQNTEWMYRLVSEKAANTDVVDLSIDLFEMLGQQVQDHANGLPGMYGDLLQGAFNRVNFKEVAGTFYN